LGVAGVAGLGVEADLVAGGVVGVELSEEALVGPELAVAVVVSERTSLDLVLPGTCRCQVLVPSSSLQQSLARTTLDTKVSIGNFFTCLGPTFINQVEPLPTDWCESVIRILNKGASTQIRWSFRARQDWQQFGMPYEAFFRLAKTLQQPGIWGERVIGMIPQPNAPKNAGSQVVYGFLSPHPLVGPKPLYAKIGLFTDKITIDLFSLHIDLTGDLARRIAQA
jgi:hypothetical protein